MGNDTVLNTYAAYAQSQELKMSSSSGAIFSLLAESVLNQDGVVYGVAMSKDCTAAEFIRVDDRNDLPKLRGSKYLQAKMGKTYQSVKADLQVGIEVLFSGSGCQVNGLKAFLGKEYKNLFCLDVICHGVPSPALWRKYVEHKEKEYGGKVVSVNFRCKDESWMDFDMKEIDENQEQVYLSKDKDLYMQMFLRDYCLRPSCYACEARKVRCSDITIADFWGIDNVAPEMNDGKGTSLVLVRTEKGKKIFNQIADSMVVKEVSYEDGVKGNPAEYKSPARPPQRDTFFSDMSTLSFFDMECKYAAPLPVPLKRKIKRLIKKIILQTPVRKLIGGGIEKGNGKYGLLFTFDKNE